MRRGRWLLCGILTLASMCCAPAPRTARAAVAMLLRTHWTVGEHFSQMRSVYEVSTFKVKRAGASSFQTQVNVEDAVLLEHRTVLQLYPDGSALVRTTYGSSSVTANGVTTRSRMQGYYEDDRVGIRLGQISSTTNGAAGIPKPILAALSSGATLSVYGGGALYPLAPVHVGSTWTVTVSRAGIGALTLHLTIVAFGSRDARPTVTISMLIQQPWQLSQSGTTLVGMVTGRETTSLFVDNAAPVQTQYSTLTVSGKLTGKDLSGKSLTGTYLYTMTETDQPSA